MVNTLESECLQGSLLMESKRAASVVAVSLVETLVLNKWDFHRHCDKDVIKALAKHEYKREEEFYNFYMKTRKWEMFKVLVFLSQLQPHDNYFQRFPTSIITL